MPLPLFGPGRCRLCAILVRYIRHCQFLQFMAPSNFFNRCLSFHFEENHWQQYYWQKNVVHKRKKLRYKLIYLMCVNV